MSESYIGNAYGEKMAAETRLTVNEMMEEVNSVIADASEDPANLEVIINSALGVVDNYSAALDDEMEIKARQSAVDQAVQNAANTLIANNRGAEVIAQLQNPEVEAILSPEVNRQIRARVNAASKSSQDMEWAVGPDGREGLYTREEIREQGLTRWRPPQAPRGIAPNAGDIVTVGDTNYIVGPDGTLENIDHLDLKEKARKIRSLEGEDITVDRLGFCFWRYYNGMGRRLFLGKEPRDRPFPFLAI